jgi:MoxR-like ATPase
MLLYISLGYPDRSSEENPSKRFIPSDNHQEKPKPAFRPDRLEKIQRYSSDTLVPAIQNPQL